MGGCMSQPTTPTPVSRHISRATQTLQLIIPENSSSELVAFTEHNRNGNLIERVSNLEESQRELSITVNVLLSEIARVKKETSKIKKEQ